MEISRRGLVGGMLAALVMPGVSRIAWASTWTPGDVVVTVTLPCPQPESRQVTAYINGHVLDYRHVRVDRSASQLHIQIPLPADGTPTTLTVMFWSTRPSESGRTECRSYHVAMSEGWPDAKLFLASTPTTYSRDHTRS